MGHEQESTDSGSKSESHDSSLGENRRGFFAQTAAILIGGVVTVVPFLAGLYVFLDPLRKRNQAKSGEEPGGFDSEGYIKVGSIDSLPADGSPAIFRIVSDDVDAWTVSGNQPIGKVYIRKADDDEIVAFNASCPHAGCDVDYRPSEREFLCPCHNSDFSIDGGRSADSPSARDLDQLPTTVKNDSEIWVKFQNFRTGTAEQIPTV